MAGLKYDSVYRYDISVKTDGPLRIGGIDTDDESVLVHPIDGYPYVQASSIAGAIRNYGEKININTNELFGQTMGENAVDSRVRVFDGIFGDSVKMELRPHVRINRKTGSASFATVKGTDKKSGQKFNTEYIGVGQTFVLSMYLYDDSTSSLKDDLEKCLSGIASGSIRFGGEKSCGAGVVVLNYVNRCKYNLRDEKELKAWLNEKECNKDDITNELSQKEPKGMAYNIVLIGKTEGGIQIKGLAENEFGEDAADSSSIKNINGDYIIPGSSLKGTIRSRMEMIAEYMELDSNVIDDIFGKVGDGGHAGNIYFKETIIGDAESVERIPRKHRLHVDKFTGGVINPFQEQNAAGDISIEIDVVDRNNPKRTLALLIMALRDMANGLVSLGNGYANGKGIVDVSRIEIVDVNAEKKASIIYDKNRGNKIDDEGKIINNVLKTLKGGESHNE